MAGIWSQEEIEQYTQEGYDALVMATGCLWATAVFPDFAYAFTHTNDFEPQYILTPGILSRSAQFTSEFERDYLDNADGPANHSYHWEQNGGYVLYSLPYSLEDLPEDLYEIERATWNTLPIDAIRSRSIEMDDMRYELNRGQVEAYLQDKDGLRRLRKWRVPSAPYVPYATDTISDVFDYTADFETDYFTSVSGETQATSAVDAQFATTSNANTGARTHNYLWETTDGFAAPPPSTDFGVLVQITEIDADTPLSNQQIGDFVQVGGQHAFGDPWGIIVAIYSEPNDMRIEYRRRGVELSKQDFEIPLRYQTYVRHYAQARALEREGDGQDLELAAHYQARYEAGVQRMLARKQAMQYQRKGIIGGGSRTERGARLRMPWQFGSVVR